MVCYDFGYGIVLSKNPQRANPLFCKVPYHNGGIGGKCVGPITIQKTQLLIPPIDVEE